MYFTLYCNNLEKRKGSKLFFSPFPTDGRLEAVHYHPNGFYNLLWNRPTSCTFPWTWVSERKKLLDRYPGYFGVAILADVRRAFPWRDTRYGDFSFDLQVNFVTNISINKAMEKMVISPRNQIQIFNFLIFCFLSG